MTGVAPVAPPAPIGDQVFWSGYAPRQAGAYDFTSFYDRRAWEHAAVADGADVLDIACGTGAPALVAAAGADRRRTQAGLNTGGGSRRRGELTGPQDR